jgi:hypothetical protein
VAAVTYVGGDLACPRAPADSQHPDRGGHLPRADGASEEQELIIGRTKLADLELPDEVKPPDSHLALNVITGADGEERQIMRFNMPFGRVGAAEFDTYFFASCSPRAICCELVPMGLTSALCVPMS